ncbi:MAG: ATP-binding protein [Planctomycetes bacterium]|nr:ATP-binding protein [Planctomycetota bacterium]
MVIPSNLKAAREVEEHVLTEVARLGYDEASAFAIKLALEEGINNAIRHGNRYDAGKVVEVDLDMDERRVIITITDQGTGFNPNALPDPTRDENLEKPNGRGVMLMRAYMDEVVFNARGNQVSMKKKRLG